MRNKKLIVLLIIIMVLVLVIVVCSATFLVRHVDAYSYYEHSDLETYNKKVVDAADVKLNSSMFFVDEQAIKSKVEKAYPEIEVINVKRSFPDRVTVNYVIYEKIFQYENGGKYYQCYSSGRVGEQTGAAVSGLFTVKMSNASSTAIGDYFQASNGKERKYIETIIKFLHSKGVIDFQITQLIDFIDFRRTGYVYIRTNAGCSIEIHDNAVEFSDLLDRGFAAYAKMDPQLTDIVQTQGLIKVYPNLSDNADDPITCTYSKPNVTQGYTTDEAYYAAHYEGVGA